MISWARRKNTVYFYREQQTRLFSSSHGKAFLSEIHVVFRFTRDIPIRADDTHFTKTQPSGKNCRKMSFSKTQSHKTIVRFDSSAIARPAAHVATLPNIWAFTKFSVAAVVTEICSARNNRADIIQFTASD